MPPMDAKFPLVCPATPAITTYIGIRKSVAKQAFHSKIRQFRLNTRGEAESARIVRGWMKKWE